MKKAFSLIELMVVIAIVALLTAVALPSYKTYMIRSRMETILPVIETILKQMVVYANLHGQYPSTPAQIGLQANSPVWGSVNPASMSQYLYGMYFFDASTNNPSPSSSACGRLGMLEIKLNSQLLGLGSSSGGNVMCVLANKGGIIQTQCFFAYSATVANSYGTSFGTFANAPQGTMQLVPGWTNVQGSANAKVQAFATGASCM